MSTAKKEFEEVHFYCARLLTQENGLQRIQTHKHTQTVDVDHKCASTETVQERNGRDVEPSLLDWKNVVKDFMSEDLAKDILIRLAETSSDIRLKVMSLASEDISTRKLFVRGLAWSITDKEFANAFVRFGPIEEAVIVRFERTKCVENSSKITHPCIYINDRFVKYQPRYETKRQGIRKVSDS